MKAFMFNYITGVLFCIWTTSSEAYRDPRWLYINLKKQITIGPIGVFSFFLALPSFATLPRERGFRSLTFNEEPEYPNDLYWDLAYEPELGRLTAYFSAMEIHALSCQERIICDFSLDAEKYSPFSEIFLKELSLSYGPVKTTRNSLMWRYMSAAQKGYTYDIEDCSVVYPNCPYGANRVLKMPVLKLWQFFSNKINLQLV